MHRCAKFLYSDSITTRKRAGEYCQENDFPSADIEHCESSETRAV